MPTLSHFYIESLSPLYEDVQLAEIFSDSKFFVDCIPRSTVKDTLLKYEQARNQQGFDLKIFVTENFILPPESNNKYSSADKSLPEHLTGLWDVLARTPDEQGGTLIPLTNQYIVP